MNRLYLYTAYKQIIFFSLIEDSDFKDILPDDLSELHVPADEDLFSIIGPELTKDDGRYFNIS